MEKNCSATQKVCLMDVLVSHLLCTGVCLCHGLFCLYMCLLLSQAIMLPHTVLSNIHSVLLKVTFLLARGDGSVLSWLVERCHLVLALRG